MIRLAIVVEGETEEDFVKRVLAAHLRARGVEPHPILPHGRGGNISVARLAPAITGIDSEFRLRNFHSRFLRFQG